MRTLPLCFVLLACHSDHPAATDATSAIDASIVDAGTPAAPAIGTQIARVGRFATNELLNGTLLPDGSAKNLQHDAYDQASDPSTWATAQVATGVSVQDEFQTNEGTYDGLDKGVSASYGCGNAVDYTFPASTTSYAGFATLLADDRQYVDTSLTDCSQYLSLELEVMTSGGVTHTTCGGRTPDNDPVDVTYSLMMAGLLGFDNTLSPLFDDGAAPHGDVSDAAFPFLGPPH